MNMTEENEALKLKVSQLTKEVEERKVEFERYKLESQDNRKNLECELKVKSSENVLLKELQKMTMDSNSEMKCQLTEVKSQLIEMKNEIKTKSDEIETLKLVATERVKARRRLEAEVQLKSNEIEYLKKSEADSNSQLAEAKNRIALLEDENYSKSAKIDNMNLEISEGVQKLLKKAETPCTNLRSLHNQSTEMTLRARFTEISKLTFDKVYSQPTEFAGLNWLIYLYKAEDHLAFIVQTRSDNADKWSCSALVNYQLISQKDQSIIISQNAARADVHTNSTSWGIPKFVPFKDLFDEKKGFVKDDSIIVSAVIKAFPNAQ